MYLGTKKPETVTTQITIQSDGLHGIKLGATVPAALQGRKGLWYDGTDWWIGNWYDADSGKMGVNVWKKVFDGTENWNKYGTFFYVANGIAPDGMYISTTLPPALCTHYLFSSSGLKRMANTTSAGKYTPAFYDDRFEELSAWKSYLVTLYTAGTPVTVYYITATETVTDIPSDTLSSLRSLTTLDGTNNIMVDGSTVQPWLSVKYRQDLQKYVKDKLAALQAAIISLGGNI